MIGCQGICGFEDSTKVKVRSSSQYASSDPEIVALEEKDEDAVVSMLAESFLGTEDADGEGMFAWIFRDVEDKEYRYKCMEYYCRYCFVLGRRAGRQFGILDEDGKPGTRTFKAAMLTFPPYSCPGHESAPLLRFVSTALAIGAPYEDSHASKYSKSINRRRRISDAVMKESHHNVPPDDGAYWYVHMIGTSPKHRGQALAKKLLVFLQSIACGEGSSIYLECHRKVTAYYEKLGFESRLPFEVEDPQDDPNDDSLRLRGDGMLSSPFIGRNPIVYRPSRGLDAQEEAAEDDGNKASPVAPLEQKENS